MPRRQDPVTTVEELLALPDDGLRHELLDGWHVVTPAPALLHQRAVLELMYAMWAHLDGRSDVELFASPADVILGPKILVQPDLFVARVPPGGRLQKWRDVGVPVLAIEILSPGTAVRDRGRKRLIYQRQGVGEYWVLDLDARLVERWTPGDERPAIMRDRLEWQARGAGELFELDVAAFFVSVLGEAEA